MKPLLFETLPRDRPRRVMMKAFDIGGAGYGVHYQCEKCDYKMWINYETEPSRTTIRKGEPCEKCNQTPTGK